MLLLSINFTEEDAHFICNDVEFNYDIDSTSIHQIIIGAYGIVRFIQTTLINESIVHNTFEQITLNLELLEERGVLMMRKPHDLGSWYVNEVWYECHKSGKVFTGVNRKNIDWV